MLQTLNSKHSFVSFEVTSLDQLFLIQLLWKYTQRDEIENCEMQKKRRDRKVISWVNTGDMLVASTLIFIVSQT